MSFTKRIAGIKRIAGVAMPGGALLLGSSLIVAPAQAGYVVTLAQVESDVVATGSGAIDLSGLTGPTLDSAGSGMIPDIGDIITGPGNLSNINIYTGITGPGSFGSGHATFASGGSGDKVGIVGAIGRLFVPAGYVSGDLLSSSSFYADKNFNVLGVTPGTYAWTWGEGENQNFTLIIGVPGSGAAVTEPASAALLGTAMAGLLLAGMVRRRRGQPNPREA